MQPAHPNFIAKPPSFIVLGSIKSGPWIFHINTGVGRYECCLLQKECHLFVAFMMTLYILQNLQLELPELTQI